MNLEGSLATTKHFVAHTLTDNMFTKFVVGLFASVSSMIFTGNEQLIQILIAIFIADAVCWIARAIKLKQFSSNKLIKGWFKLGVYFTLIFIGVSLDKVLKTGNVLTNLVFAYIVVTDSISILENLDLMGFNVPIGLVKFLKVSRDRINKKFEESEVKLEKEIVKNDEKTK